MRVLEIYARPLWKHGAPNILESWANLKVKRFGSVQIAEVRTIAINLMETTNHHGVEYAAKLDAPLV